MKVKPTVFVSMIISLLMVFAFGCAPTATAIYPQWAATVTVTGPAFTIPLTTYPPNLEVSGSNVIIVIGGGYADSITQVGQGQTIQWINYDHEAHTVTATGEYAGLFDFTLQPGQSVEYSFPNADTYQYYDKLHQGESAAIIVDLGGD